MWEPKLDGYTKQMMKKSVLFLMVSTMYSLLQLDHTSKDLFNIKINAAVYCMSSQNINAVEEGLITIDIPLAAAPNTHPSDYD